MLVITLVDTLCVNITMLLVHAGNKVVEMYTPTLQNWLADMLVSGN